MARASFLAASLLAALAVCLAAASATSPSVPPVASSATKPHILYILIDDLGHAQLGYQRATPTREVQTPNIDALVASGVKQERFYVHKFCSPSRCSIQSGRAPVHVNAINAAPQVYNPADPVGGYSGMPRNMTGMAEHMQDAGYVTKFVGKWDVGMATPDHTPQGRGYDDALIYFSHANDYWTFADGTTCADPSAPGGKLNVKDLYLQNKTYSGPASSLVNTPKCTQEDQHPGAGRCVYEDEIFKTHVKNHILQHDTDPGAPPLFMFWAPHIVHGPMQVPDANLQNFSFINNTGRQKYHTMVNYIDGAIGEVVDALKQKGMYDNTLIVFHSDNGGPLPSGNNFPLRGGKFSNWEGGIRVSAFVSGGFLPQSVRGTSQEGLMAAWDWLATLCDIAGCDPTDHRAAAAGLAPIDSLSMWPLISGANSTSPRTVLEIGSNLDGDAGRRSAATSVGGVIVPPLKLLLGYGGPDNSSVGYAVWTGPESPNATKVTPAPPKVFQQCGRTPATGCLYDVYADPTEHTNLAAARPDDFARLLAIVEELEKDLFSPDRGDTDPAACALAVNQGGFWGPFLA